MTSTVLKPLTVAVAAVSLVGCFSSSSSSDGTGSLSLDVTDAPVDSLETVSITFTGVTLKPADGERLTIELEEEQTINNMLDLQRGNAASLLSDEEVPAGEYNFIQLELNNSELFVEDSEGRHDLNVPSGAQQGLRLVSGFTVPQGGAADFTIDFDLRKAITNPSAKDFKLRPALRLVDNVEVGQIAGVVHSEVLDACENTDGFAGAVYVYEGSDVEPFDYSEERSPLMSASVDVADDESEHSYVAAFLTEGDYTIAYTCDLDDPEEEEDLEFQGERNVTVVADETQEEDFEGSSE